MYLDPMKIEVDEYNVRHDSPIDEDVIEKIKKTVSRISGIKTYT